MHSIDIKRTHSLAHDKAKTAVQHVADHIAEKFGVDCVYSTEPLT